MNIGSFYLNSAGVEFCIVSHKNW